MSVVAVRLTGRGVGAIAVIGVYGIATDAVIAKAVGGKIDLAVGAIARATIVDDGQAIDDGVVARVGPHAWEVHVHGGVAVVDAVMAVLEKSGARRLASDGFLGGNLRGEVLNAMSLAVTMTGARLLATQVEGGLGAWGRSWIEPLTRGIALWQLQSDAQWLLVRSTALRKLLWPARVAIVGEPNAGKSTLANALLGRAVSITSDIAGTTRDWVEAGAVFVSGNVTAPVVLVDTAGVRETGDAIERESIARGRAQAEEADMVVRVVDGSAGARPSRRRRREVVVVNKIDLGGTVADGEIGISAKERRGLESLMTAVMARLDLSAVREGEPFVFTERQRHIVEAIVTARDASEANRFLAQLPGTDYFSGGTSSPTSSNNSIAFRHH